MKKEIHTALFCIFVCFIGFVQSRTTTLSPEIHAEIDRQMRIKELAELGSK